MDRKRYSGIYREEYRIWGVVKKYTASTGVEHMSLHGFRHILATRRARNPQVDQAAATTFLCHIRLDDLREQIAPPATPSRIKKALQKVTETR